MATSDRLAKFTTAMQRVYRFPTTTEPWTPPPASAGHKGRYLWTDAFGLLNFLTLHKRTSSPLYLQHARSLATAVHDTLGRTRDGTARLPGASAANPLGGGLRIGKEAASGSDGDGQYHHYLTLWMFALSRLSRASGEKRWNDDAVALMRAVHPAFVYDRDKARPRMFWKVKMDLSAPLVRIEGNLDPVDGLAVCLLLRETDGEGSDVLEDEIADYEKIVKTKWEGYSSQDPLDLGMTLWTAHWFAGKTDWATGLVERAKRDLRTVIDEGYFDASVRRRLAFREFGTCLGIGCATEGEEWAVEARNIVDGWEKAGVAPVPVEDGSAGLNAEPDLLPITLVMYAAALDPGAFKSDFF
ncbi:uncharacterized protein K452DRAFT_322454 [Aplosporella prunicola CBS 121167]|uniref:Uncharacterized protein n=1 Tax=Aplosporella prunicola CBS 121167 TaxID=1176127 RepID=A0A6A6AZH1_9PEZI|nr:uncharacterized protein K452DRAFT_322454 [Aplosporella prunicola CBS 121167]KAF2136404.1 hypothetical protein K452DRAFT_322454 [Aplosporella prunicola CBS 121167]